MSSQSVLSRVSRKCVKQECPAKVSSKSVQQECQARVSSRSVQQDCPARVSRKNVKQECLGNSVKQECPAECQARESFQEWPARRCCSLMTVRVISTKKRPVFFISALVSVHSALHKVTAFGFVGSIRFHFSLFHISHISLF